MKKVIQIFLVLLLTSSFLFMGCASSKKGSCGCPAKTGMIGY